MTDDDPGRHAGTAPSSRDRRDYRPAWRCEACGAIHEERPERCPACGHDSFRVLERWTG